MQLLGAYNDITSLHDLSYRPGFVTGMQTVSLNLRVSVGQCKTNVLSNLCRTKDCFFLYSIMTHISS